jgi:NADH dehydrogenase FAD-containing subunit
MARHVLTSVTTPRAEHHVAVLEVLPAVGWLEVHSENHSAPARAAHRALDQIREHYPISLHGIRLSGFTAWLMWRGLYLLPVPAFARKSRLLLEWNRAMFFPPDISHLGYRRTQQKSAIPVPDATPVAKAG